MSISKEFILAEIEQVQRELQKAQVFVIQAETSLSIYRMLLSKLEEPVKMEPEKGTE
jgi:hypothetical protein